MKQRFLQFMQGRYGSDGFNRFICVVALVLFVCGTLLRVGLLTIFSLALLTFAYYRMFSRATARRAQENAAYYQLRRVAVNGVSARWQAFWQRRQARHTQRKTHRFFHCPSCGQTLRVPRGRGKIEINCPKCHKVFLGKS